MIRNLCSISMFECRFNSFHEVGREYVTIPMGVPLSFLISSLTYD